MGTLITKIRGLTTEMGKYARQLLQNVHKRSEIMEYALLQSCRSTPKKNPKNHMNIIMIGILHWEQKNNGDIIYTATLRNSFFFHQQQ